MSKLEGNLPALPDKETLSIGSRVEMFVDPYLIDETFSVSLRLNHPRKENVAITFDQPWEGRGSGAYASFFYDGERYRAYYRANSNSKPKEKDEKRAVSCFTCLAFSDDGIHWEKPKLGLVDFDGSTENNIILAGKMCHNFSPFYDTNPDCPPEAKYKAVSGHAKTGLTAWQSEDGLHWKTMQDEPVIREGAFDSQNLCFYDARIQAYRCYSRYFARPTKYDNVPADGKFPSPARPDTLDDLGIGVRAIQSAVSKDFLHWSEQKANTYRNGTPLEHFYTNATIPCPGAEHILISSPMRFLHDRHKSPHCAFAGVSDNVLMTSRDGVCFDRTFMEGWIRPELGERNWSQRNYISAWGLLETGPEELSMYVGEHYEWDDAGIRRYTIRRHGFASVNAPYSGGMFTTKPFIFTGKELHINYATSAAGSIRVGIVNDGTGWPACGFGAEDCDIIYGNELDHVVTWRGSSDLSQFEGKEICLMFEMKDADLYAIQFR